MIIMQPGYLMKLNCLIVDDEPLARKGLQEYIDEIEFLNRVGSCENALKASHYLSEQHVDLIYLDIQMPRLSGIEFLKTIKSPPLTIFTTAHTDYAIESYSLDVIEDRKSTRLNSSHGYISYAVFCLK